MGNSSGTITASYATGDATATASGNGGDANAGGLVGDGGHGTATATASGQWFSHNRQRADLSATAVRAITASYSTGGQWYRYHWPSQQGGLVGAGTPTATNSYWDIDSSDIATTTTDADYWKDDRRPASPTATSTDSIYAMWDDGT